MELSGVRELWRGHFTRDGGVRNRNGVGFGEVMFEILISPDWAHLEAKLGRPLHRGKPGQKRRE